MKLNNLLLNNTENNVSEVSISREYNGFLVNIKGNFTENLFKIGEKHNIISNIPILCGNQLFIFKNCLLNGYDINIGYGDKITSGNLELISDSYVCYDTLETEFIDGIYDVNPEDIFLVYLEYGDPMKMTHDEFCQKCLAVKI